MDFDLFFNLTKEDLLGTLKTIYSFLDGTNFKKASVALQEECISKGFDFDIVPKKLVIQSRLEQSASTRLSKSTQTVGVDDEDEDKSYQLQSSIHSETETKEELLFYYKEPFTSYTISSREILINIENTSTNSKSSYDEKKKLLKSSNINLVKTHKIIKSQSEPILNISSNDIKKQPQVEKGVFDRKVLKKKMRLLENDYKKLMGVTTELTSALQTHIMGQSENLNATLNKCKRIYPELFKKPEDDDNEVPKAPSCNDSTCQITVIATDPANEPLESIDSLLDTPSIIVDAFKTTEESNNLADNKPVSNTTEDTSGSPNKEQLVHKPQHDKKPVILCPSRNYDPTLQDIGECECSLEDYFELDYKQLKTDLISKNCELQLALVVALRKAIISEKDLRNSTMNSYMKNDLLNILPTSKSDKKNIVVTLFGQHCKDSVRLQEETSRLINTIASLKLGRKYLCQSDDFLISFLVPVVKGTYEPKVELNSTTEEMLIATVQKLSLKYRQRERMIAADLTEYVVKFLTEKHLGLSRYCLEYSTALFMNLCLHRNARKRLRPFAKEVIDLLANLLNAKHDFCMPYVNGAIFSLLWDEQINQEARRQNFFDLIQYHVQQTDGERRDELEHIIKVHLESTNKEACSCDSTIEPEFEVDMLEPELDGGNNSLTNEDILLKYSNTKSRNINSIERPTPLERSTSKPAGCAYLKKNVEAPNMSYCEETMQFYYTPTKRAIFESEVKRRCKIEPPLFAKKPGFRYSHNCACHFCLGKTTPYVSNNSLARRISSSYNVPVCYRDNYERFKINSKENRYNCNCFRLVSKDVEFDNNNYKPNENDNNQNKNVTKRYHFCPMCQKYHQLDEAHVEICNRKNSDDDSNNVDDGVVNFSFRELSDISGEQTRSTNQDGSCYDVVFQSRPKILRTPP